MHWITLGSVEEVGEERRGEGGEEGVEGRGEGEEISVSEE